MKDIDINSLIDKGYVEDVDISISYEHKYSRITLSGFILMFSPALGYYLNNETLTDYYWFIAFPFGFFLILASIVLVHTGAPVSPVSGKRMQHYRCCIRTKTSCEDYVDTFDVWVCHEGKIFCKRQFMRTGDFV